MKTPKFLRKFAAVMQTRPKKKYLATARVARPQQMEEPDSGQPTTKLSSAFVVVLILHLVAVGGIYAFNSIKASRRSHAQILAATNTGAAAPAPAAADTDSASAATPVPATNLTASHPTKPVVAAAPVAPSAPLASATAVKPSGLRQYVVKAGDNVTKIAFAYRVTSADLLAANGLKDNAVLHVGEELAIPASKPDTKAPVDAHKAETPAKLTDIPPTKTTPGLYLVKKGDTAHSIAKAYGMTAEELIKLNKIADPKKLQLGQALKIPPRKS
jgi:LysM repeat protein